VIACEFYEILRLILLVAHLADYQLFPFAFSPFQLNLSFI
jgi:hypothetical protein